MLTLSKHGDVHQQDSRNAILRVLHKAQKNIDSSFNTEEALVYNLGQKEQSYFEPSQANLLFQF